jgi:hypothetical protein
MPTGLLYERDAKGEPRRVYSHHVGGPAYSLFAHQRQPLNDGATTPDAKRGCAHLGCESEVAIQRVCGHRICEAHEPGRGKFDNQCKLCIHRTEVYNLPSSTIT